MFHQLVASFGDRLIALGQTLKKSTYFHLPPVEISIRGRKARGKTAFYGVGVDRDGNKINRYLSTDEDKAKAAAARMSEELSGFL